ncbi:RNA 2',3'-cyclic phosphodiesterase [Patescibacteria group bacterium]
MKRIFIAISISEGLQNKILEWGKSYENLPVRWLKGKNLHITLIPPWYCEEEKIQDIEKIIDEVLKKISSFEIVFRKISYGPNLRQPRLIWIEAEPQKIASNLKTELEKSLGKKAEHRPWLVHMTLARFRPETFSSFPIKKLDEIINWEEKVESAVIMESMLSPTGADYKILHKADLYG